MIFLYLLYKRDDLRKTMTNIKISREIKTSSLLSLQRQNRFLRPVCNVGIPSRKNGRLGKMLQN